MLFTFYMSCFYECSNDMVNWRYKHSLPKNTLVLTKKGLEKHLSPRYFETLNIIVLGQLDRIENLVTCLAGQKKIYFAFASYATLPLALPPGKVEWTINVCCPCFCFWPRDVKLLLALWNHCITGIYLQNTNILNISRW